MPICAMFGCRSRSKTSAKPTYREPGIGMFCLPKVITWQCKKTQVLSENRRSVWLARINRKDLKNLSNVRVCGRHFITGKSFNRSNLNGLVLFVMTLTIDRGTFGC